MTYSWLEGFKLHVDKDMPENRIALVVPGKIKSVTPSISAAVREIDGSQTIYFSLTIKFSEPPKIVYVDVGGDQPVGDGGQDKLASNDSRIL